MLYRFPDTLFRIYLKNHFEGAPGHGWLGMTNALLQGQRQGARAEARRVKSMDTNLRVEFLRLVSTVVGLSVGVGVMTATVLIGAAALLQ